MIIGNAPGMLMCFAGFGVAIGIGEFRGNLDEGLMTLIAGPIVISLDVAYRSLSPTGHWFIPSRGGHLFFAPAWCLGVLWTIVGVVKTFG